jgi:hypothetical protein
VSLVQGPPGTGKTFVGAKACVVIVNRTKESILCVCQTNHALDQFLSAVISMGVKDVVRMGGRSKNEALLPYTMWAKCKQLQETEGISRGEQQRRWELYRECDSIAEEVQRCARLLVGVLPENRLSRSNAWEEFCKQRAAGKGSRGAEGAVGSAKARYDGNSDQEDLESELWKMDDWTVVGPFLKEEQTAVWEQLQVPTAREPNLEGSYLWKRWVGGLDKGALQVMQGDAAGPPTAPPGPTVPLVSKLQLQLGRLVKGGPQSGGPGLADIWAMPSDARRSLACQWRTALRAQWSADLGAALQALQRTREELRALDQGSWEEVISRARIIGCTTTGAAMFRGLLQVTPWLPKLHCGFSSGDNRVCARTGAI